MDGGVNGTQETQEQRAEGSQEQQQQAAQEAGVSAEAADVSAYEAQIAERDARIAELEGQIAEAAKSAEAAKELKSQLREVKKQAESDKLEFSLKLAGCRNVKAAKAVLDDYQGDIDAMKEAEPWLFAKHAPQGATGLPSAGAADDAGKDVKHWRELAGLEDEK